jgi:hypothetical protein
LFTSLLCVFALTAAFQNCSRVDHSSSGDQSSSSKDNGEPYYGKPYDNGSGCAGTDSARARILYVSATEAYLTKDNCQPVFPAKPLAAGDFQLDSANPNQLFYQGATFVASHQAALAQKLENSYNPGGSSISASLSSPTSAGNLLVCFFVYANTSVSLTAVQDSQGKAFRRALAPQATVGVAAGSQVEAWYSENISAGVTGFTAQFSAAVGKPTVVVCSEFSGVVTSGSLDAATTSNGLTSNGTATIGPIATNAVDDLILAGVWHNGNNPTPGAGYTLLSNFSYDIYMYGNSADPGSYTATANGVGDWMGIALAFKTK